MNIERQFSDKDDIIRAGLVCALYWFADRAKRSLCNGNFDFKLCMNEAEKGIIEYYPRNVGPWNCERFPYSKEEWQGIWEQEKKDFELVAWQYAHERMKACVIGEINGATAIPRVSEVLDGLGMPYRVFQMHSGVRIYVDFGKAGKTENSGEYAVLNMKYEDITDSNLSKLCDYIRSLKEMSGIFCLPMSVRRLTMKERTAFNSSDSL